MTLGCEPSLVVTSWASDILGRSPADGASRRPPPRRITIPPDEPPRPAWLASCRFLCCRLGPSRGERLLIKRFQRQVLHETAKHAQPGQEVRSLSLRECIRPHGVPYPANGRPVENPSFIEPLPRQPFIDHVRKVMSDPIRIAMHEGRQAVPGGSRKTPWWAIRKGIGDLRELWIVQSKSCTIQRVCPDQREEGP